MKQGTILKNVNVLDMRNTTKETMDKIELLKNINVILVSPETAGLLTGIPSRGLNATAHVAANTNTCLLEAAGVHANIV